MRLSHERLIDLFLHEINVIIESWLYLKPGMEQTETERKKIRLKFSSTEQLKNGLEKKFEKKKYFLIYFRLKCGNGTFRTELFFNFIL